MSWLILIVGLILILVSLESPLNGGEARVPHYVGAAAGIVLVALAVVLERGII